MCTYIFAVLPADVDPEALQPILGRFGKRLRPAEQEDFYNVSGRIYYTTTGHCDCKTPLGSRSFRNYREERRDVAIQKLRRKGWSEAKIARWQEEKEHSVTSRTARQDQTTLEELDRWQSLLLALLNSGTTPWLGLLHHFTAGQRKATVGATVEASLESLDAEFLMQMQEDTLYRWMSPPTVHRNDR